MHEATCPRCTRTYDGRYPAMSRATPERDIEVCPACGTCEAVGFGPVPVAQWPVVGAPRGLGLV